jgi:hypothetical protein
VLRVAKKGLFRSNNKDRDSREKKQAKRKRGREVEREV